MKKYIKISSYILSILFLTLNATSEELNMREILEIIQKDLRTLERAVYSESFQKKSGGENALTGKETEDVLTRHLLKLSEIEKQFQNLTNKFEEVNFKIDKLSSRLSKTQADNQLRFQELENNSSLVQKNKINEQNLLTSENNTNNENIDTDLASKKIMPGTSQPQDLGTISYKDMTNSSETQAIQSVETTKTILTENFINEEKILPDASPLEQYEFATSFLKVGDYNMAERAFREFVDTNPDNDLSGNAQYWYAETFRIRQLYTDAASAYLEGYQRYPKSEKAPINLLKLGVSLVQIGEKDQGCLMIAGVKKQYPNATQSVLQKAKYEEKKFECNKENS
ncbi:tol-pal system protein [Pelagibacteraceae bacterium GOM-A1]|nr:tol-pal system protein [Pelagibacteraceae bacterium GOM-A1]